jgi:hypothetical protein
MRTIGSFAYRFGELPRARVDRVIEELRAAGVPCRKRIVRHDKSSLRAEIILINHPCNQAKTN